MRMASVQASQSITTEDTRCLLMSTVCVTVFNQSLNGINQVFLSGKLNSMTLLPGDKLLSSGVQYGSVMFRIHMLYKRSTREKYEGGL